VRFKLETAAQGWLTHPFLVPREFRGWLTDQGSLTHRLRQRCGTFSVRPVRIGFLRPNRDESAVLQLRPDEQAYVREVLLNCNGKAVVFAHSVVAASSLRGPWAAVTGLGSRPLGEALFGDPRVTRGCLQYRRIDARHALARQAAHAGIAVAGELMWARRSLFTLHGHPLMVTEVFLPSVLEVKGEAGRGKGRC
jgi:4-hydroxybenzoate synthetase (chorismate lyase)